MFENVLFRKIKDFAIDMKKSILYIQKEAMNPSTLDMKALRRLSRWSSDWQIARLVGSATYAQLMDSAPGLFEPFPDWRGDGNSANSIQQIVWGMMAIGFDDERKNASLSELKVPYPPNLVSTLLADGAISCIELKLLLVDACLTGRVDPLIEPLLNSSIIYQEPVMTLGEILAIFLLFSFLVSILVGLFIKTHYVYACTWVGGCGKK